MLKFRIGVLINVQSVPYLDPKEITITWAMEIKTFSRPIRDPWSRNNVQYNHFLWSKIPGAKCVMDVVAN
jgi:hypothetical protein